MKHLYYCYFSNAVSKSRRRGEREQGGLERTQAEGNRAFGAVCGAGARRSRLPVAPSGEAPAGVPRGQGCHPRPPPPSPAFGRPDVPSPGEGPSGEREFRFPAPRVPRSGSISRAGRCLLVPRLRGPLPGRNPTHATSWRRLVLTCICCTPKSFSALSLRMELLSASCANKTLRQKLIRKQMLLTALGG